jgi:hypothetical protein
MPCAPMVRLAPFSAWAAPRSRPVSQPDVGVHRFDMNNLIEIQEAIEKLAPEERAELWDWFQAQEVEETDEMLAAVDEGI